MLDSPQSLENITKIKVSEIVNIRKKILQNFK